MGIIGIILGMIATAIITTMVLARFADSQDSMDMTHAAEEIARAVGALESFSRIRSDWPDRSKASEMDALTALGAGEFFGSRGATGKDAANIFGNDTELASTGDSFTFGFDDQNQCNVARTNLISTGIIDSTAACATGVLTVNL